MYSDHRILTVRIRLSLLKNTVEITTTVQYEWPLLNNRDNRDNYTLSLRNKYSALYEISKTPTSNDKYENFVNAHLEEEVECKPTKQRTKPKVSWRTVAFRKKACRRENRLPMKLEEHNRYIHTETYEGTKWFN